MRCEKCEKEIKDGKETVVSFSLEFRFFMIAEEGYRHLGHGNARGYYCGIECATEAFRAALLHEKEMMRKGLPEVINRILDAGEVNSGEDGEDIRVFKP